MKGLAHTPKQARQFIVHGHISIGGRKVTIPGYLVKNTEEETIEYNQYSSLTNDLHPMRPKGKLEVTIGDGQVSRLIKIKTSESVTTEEDTESKTKDKPKEEKEESDYCASPIL